MKLNYEVKFKLGSYLKYLEQKKSDHKTIIRILKVILDEGTLEAMLKEELPHLKILSDTSENNEAAEAWNFLGLCYLMGLGTPKDLKRAAELFERAVVQGSVDAQLNLGLCYKEGHGVPTDLKRAVELYQQASDRGLVTAQYNLGHCYYEGHGVIKDLKRAVELFQLVIGQNHSFAQNNLGFCYYKGFGVKKDLRRASLLFQAAASNESMSAEENLKLPQILAPNLSPLELEEAVGFYLKLLKDSDKETVRTALSTLGFCYQMGLGVKRDWRRAQKFYTQAVTKGCPGSLWDLLLFYRQVPSVKQEVVSEFYTRLKTPFSRHLHMECERLSFLAYLYEQGAPWLDQDLCQTYERYRTASKHPSKEGTHSLVCAQESTYVQQKMMQYTPFYRFYTLLHKILMEGTFQGIFQGIIPSLIAQYAFEDGLKYNFSNFLDDINKFGIIYRDGQGVPKDLERSAEFFQWAAEQGSAKAELDLGVCYRDGQGVPKDLKRAAELFQQAADQGLPDANKNLGDYYRENGDLKSAAECYQQASRQGGCSGLAESYRNLGDDYQKNRSITEDVQFGTTPFQSAVIDGGWGWRYIDTHRQENTWVKKDLKRSAEFYRLAAAHEGCIGLAESLKSLGDACQKDYWRKDSKLAAEFCQLAAESYQQAIAQGGCRGLAESYKKLGDIYQEGSYITKDLKLVAEFYQKSVMQGGCLGLGESYKKLGDCYKDALSVGKDLKQAVEFYQFAIEQGGPGLADTCKVLGDCYREGQGVEQDLERAAGLYKQAVVQGSCKGLASSYQSLGDCYKQGRGIEQNLERAVEFYQQAIARSDYWGELGDFYKSIGDCYREGLWGLPDLRRAEQAYREAAAQGKWVRMAEPYKSLGDCYREGSGFFRPDLKRAAKFYQLAKADQGHCLGLDESIRELENRSRKDQDLEQELAVYQQGTSQKDLAAAYKKLGDRYREGLGVKPDLKRAAEYYHQAVVYGGAVGLAESYERLADCYKGGHGGVQPDLKRAAEFYHQAAIQGSVQGQYKLGVCYEEGLGVEQSSTRALEFYRQTKKRKPIKTQDTLVKAEAYSETLVERGGSVQQRTTITPFYQLYTTIDETYSQQRSFPEIVPLLITQYAREDTLKERLKP